MLWTRRMQFYNSPEKLFALSPNYLENVFLENCFPSKCFTGCVDCSLLENARKFLQKCEKLSCNSEEKQINNFVRSKIFLKIFLWTRDEQFLLPYQASSGEVREILLKKPKELLYFLLIIIIFHE